MTSPVSKSSTLTSESLPTERTLCSFFCRPEDWEMPQAQSYPTDVSHPGDGAKGLGQARALGLGCFSRFCLSESSPPGPAQTNTLTAMAPFLSSRVSPVSPGYSSSLRDNLFATPWAQGRSETGASCIPDLAFSEWGCELPESRAPCVGGLGRALTLIYTDYNNECPDSHHDAEPTSMGARRPITSSCSSYPVEY